MTNILKRVTIPHTGVANTVTRQLYTVMYWLFPSESGTTFGKVVPLSGKPYHFSAYTAVSLLATAISGTGTAIPELYQLYFWPQKQNKPRKIWPDEKKVVPLQPQYAHISNNK